MKLFNKNIFLLFIILFSFIDFHTSHAMEFTPEDYYNKYIKREGGAPFRNLQKRKREEIIKQYKEWLKLSEDNTGIQQEEKKEDPFVPTTTTTNLTDIPIELSEKHENIVRDRFWKKSLNIFINNNNFNFIDWFEGQKLILENFKELIGKTTGMDPFGQCNVCSSIITFLIEFENDNYIVNFDPKSIYVSGVKKFPGNNYQGRKLINVLDIINMKDKDEKWIRGNKKIIHKTIGKKIQEISGIYVGGASEHAETCMVLDTVEKIPSWIQIMKDKIGKPFTINGIIMNVLTYMDPCGMGCMPMLTTLPNKFKIILENNIGVHNNIEIAEELHNCILISGIKNFKDTRHGLLEEEKRDDFTSINTLDPATNQVFVSTFQDTTSSIYKEGSEDGEKIKNPKKIEK